ncbi:chromosome partitioning protein ParB [Humibacillus sp. DSM 29435]|uniref:ParB/RepB/Spo0J family partition protein n=1 Tax=Humibacillus sp. DSM 29435 TaxID=1869167 RepID=UPI000872C7ED|nr:ParB/RepB/Spo0J family partition protein [Humibacillus sp. DSM 29435]OFE14211.1 chromosome partitioning protein ParB [Humibacillus sp. DSM 29435]
MAEKRRALGRGLGALIPSAPPAGGERPVDVFFRERRPEVGTPHPSQSGGDEPDRGLTPRSFVPGTPEPEPSLAEADAIHGEHGEHGEQGDDPDHGDAMDERGRSYSTAQTGLAPVPGAEFAEIDIASITPNPKQPRTVFDEDQMAELVHSVREIGILQPIVVRRIVAGAEPAGSRPVGLGDDAEHETAAPAPRFELIMGERRWRAAQLAGLESVPAIIKDTHDDHLLRDALLENLHRSQLNALEEAAAYQQLLDDFGCSHDDLATRIGRSRPQISNTLRLLKLPPLVQRRVAAGVLSAGHARALLGMADGGAMERMAQRIVAEGLSVRTVEELVSLGDDETPPRARRPRAGAHHPQLDDYTTHLADHLETRVNIALGQRRGKITVDFASMDDLQRILALMGLDGQAH